MHWKLSGPMTGLSRGNVATASQLGIPTECYGSFVTTDLRSSIWLTGKQKRERKQTSLPKVQQCIIPR